MELSINLLGFYGAAPGEAKVTPSEAAAMALEDGFRVFDYPLSPLATYEGDWKREIDRTLEVVEKGGAVIRYSHVPFAFPWSDPSEENWARFEHCMTQAIEGAHMLGTRYVALHPYTTNEPAETYDAAVCKEAALRHLLPWLEQADKLNVHLCAESMQGDAACYPHRRYCAKVEELIDLVDTAHMAGICWDTGHAHIAVHKQSEALRKIGSRLKMLHIHDNDSQVDEHLMPFTGIIDWEDFLSGLRAIGYQGDINYEQNLQRIPSALRKPAIRYLKAVGEYFVAQAGRKD